MPIFWKLLTHTEVYQCEFEIFIEGSASAYVFQLEVTVGIADLVQVR